MDHTKDQETLDGLIRLAGDIGMITTEVFSRDDNGLMVPLRNPRYVDLFERNRLRALLQLMNMGTSGTKHLPAWFAHESLEIRQHVFSGLIESDGHLTRQKGVPSVGFTQTVIGIVDGFHPLARSLGLEYGVHVREPRLDDRTGNYTQTAHNFFFSNINALAAALQFCKLSRKRIRYVDIGDAHEASLRFNIYGKDLEDGLEEALDIHNFLSVPRVSSMEKRRIVDAFDAKTVRKILKKFRNFGLEYGDMSLYTGFTQGSVRNHVLGLTHNEITMNYMKDLISDRLSMLSLENIVYALQHQTLHRVFNIRLAADSSHKFVLENCMLVHD